MEMYIGTKIIKASPMTRIEYNGYRSWDLPEDEQHLAQEAGMLVEYADTEHPNVEGHEGYVSWSPLNVFNEAYRKISGITFGMAIEAMKKGMKVARAGWNGKGMYAVLMPGFPEGVSANAVTAAIHGIAEGEPVKVRPYFVLKTAQNDLAMWSPSGSDALADDWCIVK